MRKILKNLSLLLASLALLMPCGLLGCGSASAAPSTAAYIITKSDDGSLVKEFTQDQAVDLVTALAKAGTEPSSPMAAHTAYTLTLNADLVVPGPTSDKVLNTGSNQDLTIKSPAGASHKITFAGTDTGNFGILNIRWDSQVTLENVVIDGQEKHRGVAVGGGTQLTMNSGAVVQNGYATKSGGAGILLYGTGKLVMNPGSKLLNNNSAASAQGNGGGAIYGTKNSSIAIDGAEISGNKSAFQGGAILAGKEITVKNSTFSNNYAAYSGGAIVSVSATEKFTVDGCTFTGNSTSQPTNKPGYGMGGAITYALAKKGDFSLTTSTFTGNKSNSGGAVTVSSNLAPQFGTVESPISMTMSGNKFTKNQAAALGGGAVLVDGVNLSLDRCEFNQNQVTGGEGTFGGAIMGYAGPAKLDVTNSKFLDNKADQAGGIVLGDDITATIKSSAFDGNQAVSDRLGTGGGALYVYAMANATISENTQFYRNTANYGGAIITQSVSFTDPADETKWQNLATDNTTVFAENVARIGAWEPPSNFAKFTNLKFAKHSFTGTTVLSRNSAMNNYDIIYLAPGNGPIELVNISYDANGGTGGVTVKANKANPHSVLSAGAAQVTRKGYRFTGWNTAKDNSGTAYKGGEKIQLSADLTLYAQWEKVEAPSTNPSDTESQKPASPRKPDRKNTGNQLPPTGSEALVAAISMLAALAGGAALLTYRHRASK